MKRTHVCAGDPLYLKGKYHYVASSEQDPACVVEPGTPEDIGIIVRSFRLALPDILSPLADTRNHL